MTQRPSSAICGCSPPSSSRSSRRDTCRSSARPRPRASRVRQGRAGARAVRERVDREAGRRAGAPGKYREIVEEARAHLRANHSYERVEASAPTVPSARGGRPMKLMFVYWAFEDQGSGLVIQGYVEAARALGHEVVVGGPARNPQIPLPYSLNLQSADAVVFLFEWTTGLKPGDYLDLVRLVGKIPRRRRVIVDGDGKYNDIVEARGRLQPHRGGGGRRWIDVCDSLTDKICQPTLHPLRSNVRPFLFYAYNPAWVRPLDFAAKDYSMLYVGHSKFRWGRCRASSARSSRVGARSVASGWSAPAGRRSPGGRRDAASSTPTTPDGDYLHKLDVEILPPVPFTRCRGGGPGALQPRAAASDLRAPAAGDSAPLRNPRRGHHPGVRHRPLSHVRGDLRGGRRRAGSRRRRRSELVAGIHARRPERYRAPVEQDSRAPCA